MLHLRRVALVSFAVLVAACASRSLPPVPVSAPAPAEVMAMAASQGDVYIRIVDVGPGLCAVITTPDGHSMVYDAGHWNGQHCIKAVRELITGAAIDLLFISHSDADHLGDAARILGEKSVKHVFLAGEPRTTATWQNFMKALTVEVENGASVTNLQSVPLVPGSTITLGDAVVTLVAGWPRWTGNGPTDSERRNAISVVAKLEYRGRSVLFTGDTVGRRLNDPDSACKDAEKVMVDRHASEDVSLKSDVLIAPHHGANNGSSTCFIEAVDPTFVIFSAGHDHQHPTGRAAARFQDHGMPDQNLFRTDYGDDESGYEWPQGRISGCVDPAGDDDIEVALRADGTVDVSYVRAPTGCDSREGGDAPEASRLSGLRSKN